MTSEQPGARTQETAVEKDVTGRYLLHVPSWKRDGREPVVAHKRCLYTLMDTCRELSDDPDRWCGFCSETNAIPIKDAASELTRVRAELARLTRELEAAQGKLEFNEKGYRLVQAQKEAADMRVEQAEQRAEALERALPEVLDLLKCVRVLDCGAHYCRYCPAKSPQWEHTPSCPYVESRRDYTRAREVIEQLAALSSPSAGPDATGGA